MYDLTPENKYELVFDELRDKESLELLIAQQEVNDLLPNQL